MCCCRLRSSNGRSPRSGSGTRSQPPSARASGSAVPSPSATTCRTARLPSRSMRPNVTFIMVGELAVADVMADRLAGSVAAGFMPVEMVPGWEAAAKSLYYKKPQTQRDEAIRSATFGASGLIHAAQAMGLGTTPMIGFDSVGVSREFSLSDSEVPALLVAVGYPTEANWPQKPRRPISDVLAFA